MRVLLCFGAFENDGRSDARPPAKSQGSNQEYNSIRADDRIDALLSAGRIILKQLLNCWQ